ncbi:hypothetical protein C1H46_004140 [Malus baccata]|uniref:Uncharacterized protein n=1 Tax=Malus baccata TaxID=106549 RepID=A0A540NGZ0_MALBA|nr:hypothetical protein C1H46_004140 [Malus baccata]
MLIVPHPLLSLDHGMELTVIIPQKPHDVPQSTTVDYVADDTTFSDFIFMFCLDAGLLKEGLSLSFASRVST